MMYLYHLVPEDMKGHIIYPLNTLKTKYPSIYREKVKKYAGVRRHILKNQIKILDCLWNDVIHMSPVHPRKIKREFERIYGKRKKWKFYKIPLSSLDESKMAVYLFKYAKDPKKYKDEKQYVSFSVKDMKKYSFIPKRTIAFWRKQHRHKKPTLLFPFIPHVLYKGTINTTRLKIISV